MVIRKVGCAVGLVTSFGYYSGARFCGYDKVIAMKGAVRIHTHTYSLERKSGG